MITTYMFVYGTLESWIKYCDYIMAITLPVLSSHWFDSGDESPCSIYIEPRGQWHPGPVMHAPISSSSSLHSLFPRGGWGRKKGGKEEWALWFDVCCVRVRVRVYCVGAETQHNVHEIVCYHIYSYVPWKLLVIIFSVTTSYNLFVVLALTGLRQITVNYRKLTMLLHTEVPCQPKMITLVASSW